MLDVTLYPELSDLVLLSDAVVSDYSSLVVDVLASDTPLALFVPDKEDFDEVGWFVDLFGEPPGPVATTTEELLPWLAEIGDGRRTPYPGRTALADRLLPLDDGHAAARVVAAEWG
jgi:CDP-glycerol glycerophosphotransferase